jgi:hypothetical protein
MCMTAKPGHIFDRNQEWAGLDAFAANPYPGAMLGVVSGRRRQGKSFLLEALTTATGGHSNWPASASRPRRAAN